MLDEKIFKTLGILGGLGPMATVYFYEMLTEHTRVSCDQEHINIIISSRATTPDRTAYILGKSKENPLPVMVEEAHRLVSAGADVIVLPCNTAHYFYDELSRATGVPINQYYYRDGLLLSAKWYEKIGLLATEGTVQSQAYGNVCKNSGISVAYPCRESQKLINEIIYDEIKQGKDADMEKFGRVAYELRGQGCDTLVLGCTELSLLKKSGHLGKYYTDSLEVLLQ